MKYTYLYVINRCMKKTLNIDPELLQEVKLATGTKTDTEAVRLGLLELRRRIAMQRLKALAGSEPRAKVVPRRRHR